MSAEVKKHYFINGMKQRVTVTISNETGGVTATIMVSRLENDMGYTVVTHKIFEDYYSRSLIAEKLKRVTAKVLDSWHQQLDSIYQSNLPKIQEMYPNSWLFT